MSENPVAPYFDGTQPCAQVGGDLFFPETADENRDVRSFIVSLCGSCEFKQACLKYALEHDVDGYWAGTNVRDRQLMRREIRVKTRYYWASKLSKKVRG